MSEFLAEAAVLIRPDTSKFRATLLAELEAATKGITIPVQVVASQQATRELRRTVVATESATAARQKQAVADAVATKEAVNLTTAQNLAAEATSKLAAVENADALAVGEVASAKAKLRAAEAALTVARRAQTAALAVENKELQTNVAATLAAAEAEVQAAKAAATEAVAHARASSEIAAHAAAEHSLVSGARAAGVSLTGLRGATLATSGAFLVGAVSVKLLEESIHEASREQEAAARTSKVFGDQARALEDDAKGLASTLGVSTAAALDFESKLGNIFTNAGIQRKEAADLAAELLTVGGNLAAFQNVPVESTLNAETLAILGQARGLKKLGIELNAARVSAVALRQSGKDNVRQLTQEDRIRARVSELIRQTANVQDAAADRAGNLAQEEKVAKAELADLGAVIGRIALPQVTALLGNVNLLAKALGFLGDAGEHAASKVGGSQFGHFVKDLQTLFSPSPSSLPEKLKVLGEAKNLVLPKDVNRDFKDLNFQGEKFSGTLQELHQRAVELAQQNGIDKLVASLIQAEAEAKKLAREAANVVFTNAEKSLDRLREKMLDTRIAGGGLGAQLDVLEQERQAAEAKVAAASSEAQITRGGSGHDTAVKRRREAKQELADIIDQIKSDRADIQQQAEDVVKQILDAAKAAADRVQALLDAADQAFLDALGLGRGERDIKQLRVEATASLVDDVKFQKELQTFLAAEIVAARKTISDAVLRAQTIQELTSALVESQIAEKQLLHEQALNRQQRRAQAFNRAAENIDLDIQLAQTNKNIRAEIAARRRRITLDQERLKSVRGDILATKRLRNDIAEQRAAIKALKGDVDKRRQDLENLAFSFLQQQSGFVANLLSNIIPTSQIAGTVGGGAINTPTTPARSAAPGAVTPTGPSGGGGGGVIDLGGGVTEQQQKTAEPRGVTQNQATIQIELLRQILTVLRGGRPAAQHPEAVVQRIKEAVSLDIIGW